FDAANAGVDAGDYVRVFEAGRRAAALPAGDDDEVAYLGDLLVGIVSLIEGKSAEAAPRVLSAVARADEFEDPRWLAWAAVGAGATGDMPRQGALLGRAAARARPAGATDGPAPLLPTRHR